MTSASRSPARLRLSSALLTVALCARAFAAPAQDAETRSTARDLATQGAQAFEAGRYAEASDFFRRAHELVAAPSIALLQARSLAKLGSLLEAIDVYEQTARFKLPAGAPEAYSQAVQAAHREVEEVRHRVPRIKLTLAGLAKDEAPEVSIDDKPMPAVLLGVERPINPGAHHIIVNIDGQQRATRELTLAETESSEIELDVNATRPERKANAEVSTVVDGVPDSSALRRRWGWVSLGVGVVGLGVGTYTGLVALHHESNLDSACHPDCPASSAGDLDSFRSNRTISWLSYGVGVAAAATGIVLLTIGLPKHEHVAVRALPNGIQIGGRL